MDFTATFQQLNEQLVVAFDKLASEEQDTKASDTELAKFYLEELTLMVPGKEAISKDAIDGMIVFTQSHSVTTK